ncbi:MAG: TIGR03936 family radical SAM-associated protein [Clostridia bacterium]|nr:TIGR03936 family radical SAM-associated protein [Clostridia bacterium]
MLSENITYPCWVRIKFEKMNVLKFISHLDLTRTMKTALTRAGIPVWYTEGFNPHIKMVFSLPLSLGTESVCEYVDIKITKPMDFEEIKHRLGAALTSDMAVTEVYYPKMKFQDIAYALYEVTPYEKYDLSPLDAEKVMIKKHSKKGEIEVDLKERIKSIEVKGDKIMILGKADQLNYLNPEQVMALTGCSDHRIIRKEIYNERMQIFR